MFGDGGQALFKREMFGYQIPAIKHCLATRHDDVVLSGIKHVLQRLIKCLTSSNFTKHHQTNCPNAKMCRQHRIIQFLIAKHFP